MPDFRVHGHIYSLLCKSPGMYLISLSSIIDTTCVDGTVHLIGGDTISRGRVKYCYNGSWYSVCASGWGEEEAQVVCNTLGYDTITHG